MYLLPPVMENYRGVMIRIQCKNMQYINM